MIEPTVQAWPLLASVALLGGHLESSPGPLIWTRFRQTQVRILSGPSRKSAVPTERRVLVCSRRTPHAKLLRKEARLLLLCTPTGFERYFGRLAAEYAGLEPREPSGPARLVNRRHIRLRAGVRVRALALHAPASR
jgi:hypothetical protein